MAQRGFIDPTANTVYYQDVYGVSQLEQDRTESYAFDFCDTSDDEDSMGDKPRPKQRQLFHRPGPSRGVIKRPTYNHPRSVVKAQDAQPDRTEIEPADQTEEQRPLFKVAPLKNPKHSVKFALADVEEDDVARIEQLPSSPTRIATSLEDKRKQARELFAEEKARQQQLSSNARSNLIRKQRRDIREQRKEIREQRRASGEKARKVRERSLRDAAAAQACLVNDVPESGDSCILVTRSEAPVKFIDLTKTPTAVAARSRATRTQLSSKTWLPKKNWKGQKINLAAGAAYVLILSDK